MAIHLVCFHGRHNHGIWNVIMNERMGDYLKVTPDELGNCPPDFFKCDEKSCIDDVLFCDINSDCPDGNDEFWSQCIYKDLSKTDVFEDGWWHRYSNMSKTSTPKNLYDDFLRYYYKDPGFDRVRREDPPDWNGFVTFSATPDFSDLQNVLQLNTEEINEYGHQAEDFILQCSYNERPCNYSDFKSFESKVYGNCFTFNHGEDGDLRNATKSGAQYGLKLTLFTEQHEYLGIYGQESGVRVTLHHPYEMPMPEDNGLTAKTGAATSFAIRQNIYERKGKQYSDCNSTTDPIYRNYRHSTLGCRHFCLQSRMQEYCGCMDVPFYGGGKCHILNKTQEACRQLMHYLQQNQVLPCDCWPPCEEAGFDKTTSLASWPSDSYLRQLLKSINAINPKTKRISDYESAQKNLAYIEVYYDSLSVQYVKETIAYTSDDLMSDMGGLLGLYIGVSVITICEFCVFIKSLFTLFALKLTACICVRSKHKNETDETAQADEENDVGKDGAQDMNNALEIESETL
ncbi:degenerin unc-8-like [Saccoglossus kowalevskii]